MKYLIVLLFAFAACSESDEPTPQQNCATLKKEQEIAYQAMAEHIKNKQFTEAWRLEDERLRHIWYDKNEMVSKLGCK